MKPETINNINRALKRHNSLLSLFSAFKFRRLRLLSVIKFHQPEEWNQGIQEKYAAVADTGADPVLCDAFAYTLCELLKPNDHPFDDYKYHSRYKGPHYSYSDFRGVRPNIQDLFIPKRDINALEEIWKDKQACTIFLNQVVAVYAAMIKQRAYYNKGKPYDFRKEIDKASAQQGKPITTVVEGKPVPTAIVKGELVATAIVEGERVATEVVEGKPVPTAIVKGELVATAIVEGERVATDEKKDTGPTLDELKMNHKGRVSNHFSFFSRTSRKTLSVYGLLSDSTTAQPSKEIKGQPVLKI